MLNTEKDRSFMSVGSVEKSDDHKNGLAMAVSYRSGQVVNDFLNDIMKIMGKVVDDMGGLSKGIDDGVGNNKIDKGSTSVYVTENNDNGNQESMIKVMEIENLRALDSDEGSKPNLDGNLEGFGQCRLVGEDDPFLKENVGAAVVSEVARVPAIASAEAHASSEEKRNIPLELPKIPSFNEFAKRMKYTKVDDFDARKEGSCGTNTADKLSLRENSAGNLAIYRKLLTKVWVESSGCIGINDYNAIDKWISQAAAAAGSEIHHQKDVVWDEDKSNVNLKPNFYGGELVVNESYVSQVGDIKKAVADFAASLLMPLYRTKKISKESYKDMMKNTVAKVMKRITDAKSSRELMSFLTLSEKTRLFTIGAYYDRNDVFIPHLKLLRFDKNTESKLLRYESIPHLIRDYMDNLIDKHKESEALENLRRYHQSIG